MKKRKVVNVNQGMVDLAESSVTTTHGYGDDNPPPFFKALAHYLSRENITFACPGHQGTEFFSKHPVGRQFLDFFGENIFLADVPHADPMLGGVLSHEGPPGEAEKYAAAVFNADRTYFVLNGTSASNKVVANALLAPEDIVLFDRNNHKSCYHGALIQAGATPLYLETSRNALGLIGGINNCCFDEGYLRSRLNEINPEFAEKERPFRLAIIQLGTWDGTVCNAKYVVEKIGHLCDYILFDSAWLGYEQFIGFMKSYSPLLLDLDENSPGIIVTQSVHKQLAGFSQTSQIHKKDDHVKLQNRYCDHDRFNNAFMLHASTSPFYPLFISIDVNAKMHSEGNGQRMWEACVRMGVEARKYIFNSCEYITPFVPPFVDGKPWQDHQTNTILDDYRFFEFRPEDSWHDFKGYATSQYTIDPCKLQLIMPGMDSMSGQYTNGGIPAVILAHYLRENGVVPEKADCYSIMFLLTPALSYSKIETLVFWLCEFELHIKADSLLADVIPSLYDSDRVRYEGYTIGHLCQEIHAMYSRLSFNKLQKDMFSEEHFPRVLLSPQDANHEWVRGNVELVPLSAARGRIAAEGLIPYPPGIVCLAPGEQWGGAVLEYIIAIETFMNAFSYFGSDIQGAHVRMEDNGLRRFYVYVVKN
ncbi:ornithine decarboxylase [Pseudomonas sp. NFACC23-1]|uniref:ornithine decarboxylase n=1 Tax=unclassified Pseudomonas TaxID=196821 RepID=UPI00088597D6|nr:MULTISPECIES: ornithine decarboxylase [unclassified Pseudomonas]SDB66400.1 ornithine decarboxylase [Pseudomonas sp. NFACC17-2]SEJ97335.1 ornithine decarboxylase [Pseudomonas sp. NFACC23-1]SFW92987.1 ornithine decarboxylase [Pseudomonas sp. NFACC16-2]